METYVDGYRQKIQEYWRLNFTISKAYVQGLAQCRLFLQERLQHLRQLRNNLEVEKVGTLLDIKYNQCWQISPAYWD